MRLPVFLSLLLPLVADAQEKTDSLAREATVEVTVTDMQLKPRKGEEVLFTGAKSGNTLSGITDATGKFNRLLPPGDQYRVSLKSVNDTTMYLVLTVPALDTDEYFTEPFWVNVKIDPPRQYRLDHVYFDVDKASLRPDSYTELGELLLYLQRHDYIKVEIAGHTDNTGDAAHNQQLSQDRANAIRNYLVQKGIKAERLLAKGYGASKPVADNGTEKGRQLNRRTEVKIL